MNSEVTVRQNDSYSFVKWINLIEKTVIEELRVTGNDDSAHDFGHLLRVSALSRQFACKMGANELVVYTAGMLHDIVNLPKNHPNIKNCSMLASKRAQELLIALNFPEELIPKVCHAIHAHSFSANVPTQSIEAMCVQDADRAEALGALGLMRVFYGSGKYKTKILDEHDPEGNNRIYNDKAFALDHFSVKLLKLQAVMKTDEGRKTGLGLSSFLHDYRDGIIQDLREGKMASGRFRIAEVYQQAGRNNRTLFNLHDPFASNKRGLDPSKYALDGLLDNDDLYIRTFLDQLKFELETRSVSKISL